jgi:hypothetical protein
MFKKGCSSSILCELNYINALPILVRFLRYYRAFTDKVEHSCNFLASCWNCMTQCYAIWGFPDMNQILLHKNSKIILPVLQPFLPVSGMWRLCSTLSMNTLYAHKKFVTLYSYVVYLIEHEKGLLCSVITLLLIRLIKNRFMKMALFWVIGAATTYEMSVNFYQTTWCSNPEDGHLRTCCCENLKSQKWICVYNKWISTTSVKHATESCVSKL